MKRTQTSTEYLIILAVVIIIALIVVGVLGGIPGIGGGAGESASRAALAAQTIGITGYSITDYDTTITVRNNNKDPARINSISIGGDKCGFVSNVRLAPGEIRQIDCPNIYELEQSRAEYVIVINWTDMKTQTNFSQSDPSLKIAGEVGSKYLGVLDNTAGFSFASKGCWDASANPHPICTCYDLNLTRTQLSWNYTLQNSIDFDRCMEYFGDAGWTSGSGWIPIGTSGDGYKGVFDGANYAIGNLFIDKSTGGEVGVFGYTDSDNMLIKNLGVVDVDVTAPSDAGGIIGFSYRGSITNSYVSGRVIGSAQNAGGLMGHGGWYGNISDSYSTAIVSGQNNIGGLVGMVDLYAIIDNSYATGSVTGTGQYIGGLVGFSCSEATIDRSYATGPVSGDVGVGGLIGASGSIGLGIVITDSHSTGSVTATGNLVGGLIGFPAGTSTIDNSYTTSFISCSGAYCGGIIGSSDYGVTFTGTNTWTNYTGDGPDQCIGSSSAAPAGSSDPNCSP